MCTTIFMYCKVIQEGISVGILTKLEFAETCACMNNLVNKYTNVK